MIVANPLPEEDFSHGGNSKGRQSMNLSPIDPSLRMQASRCIIEHLQSLTMAWYQFHALAHGAGECFRGSNLASWLIQIESARKLTTPALADTLVIDQSEVRRAAHTKRTLGRN